METSKRNNNWKGVVLIVLVVVGAFFFAARHKLPSIAPTATPEGSVGLADLPLFSQGLSSANITADQIGFHDFSPDGKWLLFGAFKQGEGNTSYLLHTETGEVTKLPGMAERGIDDDRVLQLVAKGGITLYWLGDGTATTYAVGDNAFYGSLAPDGKTYVVNSTAGIKKIDIKTGTITTVAKSAYDGAYAWLSDSNRMLGYKESGENLFEAGKGRTLGMWDMTTSSFTPIAANIESKSIRGISWVVPSRIARVNTGYDDGSHDYLLNLDTNQVVDVGDTSGALMSGTVDDPSRSLFTVLGGDDQSLIGSRAIVYRGMQKLFDKALPLGYFRQHLQIVDDAHLLYIRTHMDGGKTIAEQLVLLDLDSGEEKVIKDLPVSIFTALSLSPDHKTWVLSQGKTFTVGTL